MNISALKALAKSIRALSMDGVQAANSGHPGLPMGCADLGAVLFGALLKHNPARPDWADRDRFVLSAGHGSMLLYSLLYLSGYGLSKEDLAQFRQVDSKTPGHPEYGHTQGVETTTGPLGAGLSNAVGMAIAQEMMAARFNTEEHKILDHHIYSLAGDGCLMEGISSEASSLAGHLGLGRLIVFYDSNRITIEGSTELTFTEDVMARYAAYGWQTLAGSAHDMGAIADLLRKAKEDGGRPSLILLESTIAKGAATMEGSAKTHGAPLGNDEIRASREKLGIPLDEDFYVDPEATAYMAERRKDWAASYKEWNNLFQAWSEANPGLRDLWNRFFSGKIDASSLSLPSFKVGDKMATRAAGGKILNAIAAAVPNLVGGSADLAPSNNTAMPDHGDFTGETPMGRTIHFGVREHAMGGILNGLALYGGLRPFGGTFLVFADYMRPAIRLAALMKLPVIYVFTHDSIFVGEDGPTHQPIEHITSLRIIPNLRVLRPADAQETALAWKMALERTDGPTVLALTRQGIGVFEKSDDRWEETARRGAYIVRDCEGRADTVLAATGSEVSLALSAAALRPGKKIRVVSIISRELFLGQDKSFREALIPPEARTITIETGVGTGWEAIASSPEDMVRIDRFGISAPGVQVAERFGFSPEKVAALLDQ